VHNWITKGITTSRYKLQILRKIQRRHGISEEVLQYIQTYQRIFRQILIEARRKDSDRYILASKYKSKAIWEIIKMGTGKSKQAHNIIIKQGYNFITNPQTIAESFDILST
jgi:Zn-dependent peptidase ImmA (M78 family)